MTIDMKLGDPVFLQPLRPAHLAVLDPEKKVWTLFSLLNMESPKVQKVSHWLSKIIFLG